MSRQNQYEYKHDSRSTGISQSLACRQKGITAIAMVIILVLVAFFALITIRLAPIYIEDFSVSSHLRRLAADQETRSLTDKQIYETLSKRFDIDDVKHVTEDDIIIDRQSGPMTITIEYEVRTPALGNVDMVAVFSHRAVVR